MSDTVSISIDGEIASEIVIVSLENVPRFAPRAAYEAGDGINRADRIISQNNRANMVLYD